MFGNIMLLTGGSECMHACMYIYIERECIRIICMYMCTCMCVYVGVGMCVRVHTY